MKRKRARAARKVKHAPAKQEIKQLNFLLLILFTVALVVVGYYFSIGGSNESAEESAVPGHTPEKPVNVGHPESAHHHATFLIFIHDKMVRFNDLKYYEASPHVHLHNNSFAEIHTHATNVTLGFFFETINITFNSSCIVFDENRSYCNDSTHTLKFYVDGNLSNDYGNHLTSDWERYLITYGNETEEKIQKQLERIPDPLASPPPKGKGKIKGVTTNHDKF